jgi:predicted enzyme related to lactoylglutathione lyase
MKSMQHQLSYITHQVEDLERMSQFFEKGLAMHLESKKMDYVVFKQAELRLALVLKSSLPSILQLKGNSLLSFNFQSEDEVLEHIKRLKLLNIHLIQEPITPKWGGLQCFIQDFENNVYELVYNPLHKV